MLELIAGIAVAIAALVLVVQPLLARRTAATSFGEASDSLDDDLIIPEESDSPKIRALLALREIEFDRATGKLSDEDYARLKATYSEAALAAIEADEQSGSTSGSPTPTDGGDMAEQLIQRARARTGAGTGCSGCGPRPEPGAIFCSSCGRSLVALIARPRCWVCGSDLPDDARFCANCGKKLAA